MILTLHNLALARGGRVLFENLDLGVAAGEFVVIRGRNGAGKTSLLRAIAGWLPPHAGRIAFASEHDAASRVHMIGHGDGLKGGLSVSAHVGYWAGLLGGERASAVRVLDRVGLAALADLPARILSRGQARRLALARLIVAPRPIWLLDEPAAGLDGDGKALLDAMIGAHCAAGGVALAALHEALGPNPDHVVQLG